MNELNRPPLESCFEVGSCVYWGGYMYVYMFVCLYMCVTGGQKLTIVSFFIALYLFFEARSLSESGAH